MNAPVSIREVAAHAGVSVGTVSNVLNRPDIVARPTRDRVHEAIKALGFVRNESARQLRAGRSRIIGLVVLDVANPFFTDVARGVEDEASRSGLAVILCNSDDQLLKETRYLELLEEHRVQGILITPVAGADERLALLQRRGTPGGPGRQPRRRPAGSARSPSTTSSAAMWRCPTCWRPGHERLAYIGGPLSIRQVADRRDGALRALARAGRGPADLQMIETRALNVARRAAGRRGDRGAAGRARPTGAFCANDLIALGLLQEMTRHADRGPRGHRHRRVRRHRLRRRRGRAALVGPPAPPAARPHRRPAAAGGDPRPRGAHTHRQVTFEPELEIRQSSGAIRTDA